MTNPPPDVAVKIAAAISKLNRPGKTTLLVVLGIFLASIIGLVWQTNKSLLAQVPAVGGGLREGVIGIPRFVNPLLAVSNPDRDLTMLIYSGLLRLNQSGNFIPDLAESYVVSDDGRQYTFILKPDLVWHDNQPVTAADIVFTVERIKNPAFKSPRRNNWEGVEVSQTSPREIIFNLKQPYPSFLENATLGILPAHLWQNVTAETFPFNYQNIEGIGTGPYKIRDITRDRDNLPTSYELEPFGNFALGQAKIKKLIISFYPNEDGLVAAYQHGKIDGVSALSPYLISELAKSDNQLITLPLPRVFAVFFNQNQTELFAQAEVREALDLLIDRRELIEQVLAGFGHATRGPLPPPQISQIKLINETESDTINDASANDRQTILEQAAAILRKSNWKKNESTGLWERTEDKKTEVLKFSLSTADTPELQAIAAKLKNSWEEFGIKVEVKIFEPGTLNQNVIRPRDYDALLFGEIVGRQADLYSFWHSSQRLDPGLNVALYANIAVDKLLEELRTGGASLTPAAWEQKNQAVAEKIIADTPAIFLYSPDFIYLLPNIIKNVSLGPINVPAERWLNIYDWYISTEKIWPIFN